MGFLESILIGISIAAIPGPIFFELVRRVLTKGFWSGALLSFGDFIGNVFILSLIFFGISNFLTSPVSKIVLYLAGSVILLWLGISALKLQKRDLENKQETKPLRLNSVGTGFSIAVANPIVIAFWISLTGSYLAELPSQFLAFTNIVLIAAGFMVFHLPLAAIIYSTKHKIATRYILWLSRVFGAILIAFSLSFLSQFMKLVLFM